MNWCIARVVKVRDLGICNFDIDTELAAAFLEISGARLEKFSVVTMEEDVSITAIMRLLSKSARRLKVLELDCCSVVDLSALGELLTACAHSLRSLRCCDCCFIGALSITIPLPALHLLDMELCEDLDLESLCLLTSRCPNLRSFACDNLQNTDVCLYELAIHCPLLQILRYKKGDITSVSGLVEVLQSCPDIEIVDIGCETDPEQEDTGAHAAAVMQHCRNLRAFCGVLRGEVVTPAIIEGIPNLLHLCLHACNFMTSEGLTALAGKCGELRTLELWTLTNPSTQAALIMLISSLKNVVELHFTCCELSDAVLLAVAEHCSKLQVLDLKNCSEYTEVGVAAVAQCCTALKTMFTAGVADRVITPLGRLLLQAIRPGLEFVDVYRDSRFWSSLHVVDRNEILVY
jgi:hypothetical protein